MSEVPFIPPAIEASDLSGRVLGDYRILRRLGRGAMAEVYLAEQTSLRRQVAIKVLLPHLAADGSYIERFRLEAQAAASLVHANIVQVYEVGQAEGLYYIAQEYVAGQNLKEFVGRTGPLSEKDALGIMFQVASALNKAATHGIVHRDIKPENIMLSRSGEVKVADFGLARVLTDTTLNLTQAGVTLGTPLYMSPEQVEGRSLDPRSDLYSFGVSCYHMLAGRPPFHAETALGVAVQHLKIDPPPLHDVRSDLSPQLCGIIMRLLAKDPKQRMQSARELMRELSTLRGVDDPLASDWANVLDGSLIATRVAPLQEATQRLQAILQDQKSLSAQLRKADRRRLLAGGIVLAAILGSGLAWWVRPAFLLAGADKRRSHVERQESVIDQLFQASTLNTEEAWLSVREYFPDEPFYILLADQQLARLYLHQNDYKRAKKIFTEFANLDEAEESFRAFGLAGLCVVYSFEGDPARSAAELSQLYPLRHRLDPQMARLVELVMRRNQQAVNPKTAQEWETWFKAQESGDDDRQSDA